MFDYSLVFDCHRLIVANNLMFEDVCAGSANNYLIASDGNYDFNFVEESYYAVLVMN